MKDPEENLLSSSDEDDGHLSANPSYAMEKRNNMNRRIKRNLPIPWKTGCLDSRDNMPGLLVLMKRIYSFECIFPKPQQEPMLMVSSGIKHIRYSV